MDNLEKRISRYKNSVNLPLINTSSTKRYILKSNSLNKLINSSLKSQQYTLDVKKYQTNISTKKKKLDFLKKECQKLKNRENSTDKLINLSLKFESKELPSKTQDELIFFEKENEIEKEGNKVKNYKEKKNDLELTRREYNIRSEENCRLKYEIKTINSDIKDIEYKINYKINDAKNIKNKIELTKRNIRDIKQIIHDNKERNKKLNYKIQLEKDTATNINKLNETNQTIKRNEDEINELKKKLEELSKAKKK
jgi:chromosome segregation ATPase